MGIIQFKGDTVMKKLGVQLWSVHEEFDANIPKTLKKIASMGYNAIEFAGYAGATPEEMKRYLDESGLTVMGSHVKLERLKDSFEEEIAMNTAVCNKNIVIPWGNMESVETISVLADFINYIQPKLEEKGFNLLYHNHRVEFEPLGDTGKRPIDFLLEKCPDLKFELDTGWAYAGGSCPIEFMKQHSDRIKLLHLKNFYEGEEDYVMCNISEGKINVNEIITIARILGITEHIIEDETQPPVDKYESMTKSREYYFTIN